MPAQLPRSFCSGAPLSPLKMTPLEDAAASCGKLFKDGSSYRGRQLKPDLTDVTAAVERAMESKGEPLDVAVLEALKAVSARLRVLRQTLNSTTGAKEHWRTVEAQLKKPYEHMAGLMRSRGMRVPQVRSFQLIRSLYHVSSAILMVVQAELLWSTKDLFIISFGSSCFAWGMEVAKQKSEMVKSVMFKLLGPISRDGEQHSVNSATWFMSAMFILTASFKGNKLPCCLGALALGVGDPAAAFVGSKFGQVRIYGKKTLEGTAAFFLVNLAFNLAYVTCLYDVAFASSLALCAAAAFTGAIVELYCPAHLGVDDNLLVPVATAYAAWAFAALRGLETPYLAGGLEVLGVSAALPPPPPGIFGAILPWIYELGMWEWVL